ELVGVDAPVASLLGERRQRPVQPKPRRAISGEVQGGATSSGGLSEKIVERGPRRRWWGGGQGRNFWGW
ncbi:MAG: hypothetical protein RIF41_22920, partial [Polyangiaceae bacterium]